MPLYSNFRFKTQSYNVNELIESASIENIQKSISGSLNSLVTNSILNNVDEKKDIALDIIGKEVNKLKTLIVEDCISFEKIQESLVINLLENLNELKWFNFYNDKKYKLVFNYIQSEEKTNSNSYNRQGFILFKSGNLEGAKEQFNKSIADNPLNIEAYLNLAFLELRLENINSSISNFQFASKYLSLDTNLNNEFSKEEIIETENLIYSSLFTLHFLENAFDKALEYVEKGIKLEDKSKDYYQYNKILCLLKLGNTELANEIIVSFANENKLQILSLLYLNNINKNLSKEIIFEINNIAINLKNEFLKDTSACLDKITSKNENVIFSDLLNEKINEIEDSPCDILFESEFKEKYKNFLFFIEIISDIDLRIKREEINIDVYIKKIKEINLLVNQINTDPTEKSIQSLSHSLLLNRAKGYIKNGVDKKLNDFELISKIVLGLKSQIDKLITEIKNNDYSLKYINNGLVVYLKLKSIIDISIINNLKSKESNNLQFYNEIKSLVDSYSSKDNNNISIEKTLKTVDKLSKLLDIEYDELVDLLKDKENGIKNIVNTIKKFPSSKQFIIIEIINELN